MFVWITRRLEGRLYEWALAAPTLASGIHLAMHPEALSNSAFHRLGNVLDVGSVSVLLILCGVLRLIALAVNGYSDVIGPVARCVCAALSAFLWSEIAYALYEYGLSRGVISPMWWFWASFTLAEVFVCYRAGMDVRRFVRW